MVALLKLDLCSITAILPPSRPLLAPAQREPNARNVRERRDNFIYTRRKPAATSRRKGEKISGKESERRKRRKRGGHIYSVDDASPMRDSFRVLYPARFCPTFFRALLWSPGVSRMQARPIHPRGKRRVTWIISIFAPAKVSRRDYRGATRFHPR